MNSKKYEYFDVTADIGIKVWAANINEIFENAAMVVTSLMIDSSEIGNTVVKELYIEGNDAPSLLVNWITELLIVRDSEGILFSSFKVKVSKNKKSLQAKCQGGYFIGNNLEMDIKAITYSLFKLEKLNTKYYLQFVLDI